MVSLTSGTLYATYKIVVRVYGMVMTPSEGLTNISKVEPLITTWCNSGYLDYKDLLYVRSTKMLIDGALGSRLAHSLNLI